MISKVKTILEIKERENKETKKTVFYHNCILEDWVKISLWKITSWAIKVWDEIEYEMVDDWKWWQKAKEVKKAFVKWWWFQKQKPNNAWFALAYAKDIAVAKINNWIDIDSTQTLALADLFYNWMQSHE
jgi:hypothetical protein